MAHMEPLPAEATPELEDDFALFESILGFVPNSLLTMQRRPEIVSGFGTLTRAVMSEEGAVHPGLKRLAAHVASHAAGCQYCEAHSLVAAKVHGISQEKIDELWDWPASDHYSDAERAALDFALAAGRVPNGVDEEIMARMRAHWTEGEIVEILAAICLYAFLNRWNDSMATELEDTPREMGERVLAERGWDGGKHVESDP